MAKHRQYFAGQDGWCEWVQPIADGYKMSCCDCDLVHEMQFRIEGEHVQFRARRHNRATAQKRRHAKTGKRDTP